MEENMEDKKWNSESVNASRAIPLFEHFPILKEKIPYVSLADLPTPVERLERLGRDLEVDRIYVKRDDRSGKVYGGNKIRKQEFLLGRALRDGVKEVMTFGFAGSNHALATAIMARRVGLRCISMLLRQPNASYVRRNLLMGYLSGAELHQRRGRKALSVAAIYQLLRHKLKYGRLPQLIPPGGSSVMGTLGFVNAAFELKEQIEKGLLPEPDSIYVAMGTTGTSVGLMVGLRAAKLKTKVVPVRVVEEKFMPAKKMSVHFNKTSAYLRSLDPTFPELHCSEEDLGIENGFLGEGYARFTKEGMEAVSLMRELEGIGLEGTYTGKTLAALISAARRGDFDNKTTLFWNTFNSRDFSEEISTADYHDLPECFHSYFEKDVQSLDLKF